jgi:uncharacterized membrane protein
MPPQSKSKKEIEIKKPNEANPIFKSMSEFYQKRILSIWLIIICVPIIVIIIGCLTLPELFYDQFVWRYFWGTIEADAQDKSYGEVTEAYNPVNTIFYAFIVIIVLYWTYNLFRKFKIEIDFKFILAIIPFILIGGISRALEDAELFYSPSVYLFIAPIIYIFIGLVVIGLVLIGVAIQHASKKTGLQQGIILTGAILVGLDVVYLIFYFGFSNQFSYMLNPIIPALSSLIIFLGLKKYSEMKNKIEISSILLAVGIWCLIINILVLAQWQSITDWDNAYSAVNPGKTVELRPFAFLIVTGIAFFGVFIVYLIAKVSSIKYPELKPFLWGTNLLLFFGHFLDASATFIAIDYYGYVEKHVLPTFLIDVFQTASVMFILKAIIVIIVIYFIDILYKKDFLENPTLTGLVKIAVLVLGLAPGIRDVMRLAIGV